MKNHSILIEQLPFKSSFLLITKIIEISSDNNRIVASHIYQSDDQLVQSHFSGTYISGALITEQICQSAFILLLEKEGKTKKQVFLQKVSSDYLKPVISNVSVIVEVNIVSYSMDFVVFKGDAYVDDVKVAIVKAGAKIL